MVNLEVYQKTMINLLGADSLCMRLGYEVGGKKYPAAIFSKPEQTSSERVLALLKELVLDPSEIPGTEYPFELTSLKPPDIEGKLVENGVSIGVLGILETYPMSRNPEEPKTPIKVEKNGVPGRAKVKSLLSVEIQAGCQTSSYNVKVSGLNGPLSHEMVEAFTREFGSLGLISRALSEEEKKDPTLLGVYTVSGVHISVFYNNIENTLILKGVPPHKLSKLCCRSNLVSKLNLGRYNNSAGKLKMRKMAEQQGIRVYPRE
jgi:hypothetical protein